MYRRLRQDGIFVTAEQLRLRVTDRFPGSGLSKVATELADIARGAEPRAREIASQMQWLRALVFGSVLALLVVCLWVVVRLRPQVNGLDPGQFVQILDATMNVAVLSGGAILSLITIEGKFRRSRALKALHELRAIAHVVDMHQLTKDPDRVTGLQPTEHSPDVKLSPMGLTRYLNYCSEMLSLIAKIGAFYVQDLDDAVALDAANDLEDLTSGLSRKIWQKIMIVRQFRAD